LEIDTAEQLARSDFDTQSYWVAAMEAACGAAMVAVTGRLCWPNLSTFGTWPNLSTFGTFQVCESIQREMGEIFCTGNSSSSGCGSHGADTHNKHSDMVPPGITGLMESDRRGSQTRYK